MTSDNLAALLRALGLARTAYEQNMPFNVPAAAHKSLAQTVEALESPVKRANAFIKAQPGILSAAYIILNELDRQGHVWAKEAKDILAAAPGAIAEADQIIPQAANFLRLFQPAPSYRPGPRVER